MEDSDQLSKISLVNQQLDIRGRLVHQEINGAFAYSTIYLLNEHVILHSFIIATILCITLVY